MQQPGGQQERLVSRPVQVGDTAGVAVFVEDLYAGEATAEVVEMGVRLGGRPAAELWELPLGLFMWINMVNPMVAPAVLGGHGAWKKEVRASEGRSPRPQDLELYWGNGSPLLTRSPPLFGMGVQINPRAHVGNGKAERRLTTSVESRPVEPHIRRRPVASLCVRWDDGITAETNELGVATRPDATPGAPAPLPVSTCDGAGIQPLLDSSAGR